MQNILTLETNRYSIKLDNFEGPLDLLCHLIDKNKMDIYDINLSKITDQYVDYIRQMEQLNLEITSEFLVMSSTLLYLKSKHLLPKVREEEEELTEEELIRRKGNGTLIIITTHIHEDIDELCDKVLYLENGKLNDKRY